MLVFALIGVAAVSHAAWNIAMKLAGASGVRFLWLTFVLGAVAFAPLGAPSLLGEADRWPEVVWLATVSAGLQLLYFSSLQRGYRVADVSIVYPVARGTGPLLAVLAAIAIFGERPGWFAIAGAALVVAGVFWIGLSGRRQSQSRSGILLGILTGAIIAAYTLWDATAVTVFTLNPIGYYWLSLVFQSIFFAVPALRDPRLVRLEALHHVRSILAVGLLSPVAYVLVLFAYQLAPVSIVAPAREVSIVLVTIAGWLLFREPRPFQRLLGAVVVVVGVALLAVA